MQVIDFFSRPVGERRSEHRDYKQAEASCFWNRRLKIRNTVRKRNPQSRRSWSWYSALRPRSR